MGTFFISTAALRSSSQLSMGREVSAIVGTQFPQVRRVRIWSTISRFRDRLLSLLAARLGVLVPVAVLANYREAFVGIDVAKLKNAIAIAEAGREKEVRFFGELDASATSMCRVKAGSGARGIRTPRWIAVVCGAE